jgi:DNA transposition AAA+ family ATPase
MINKLAETTNVKRFLAGVATVEQRGAREACWLAAIGDPGFGKTRTLQWWAVQHNGVYLRAKTNWRANWMLAELAAELVGADVAGATRQLFVQCLAELAKQGRALIIDEAWNMLHDVRLLETLRDLSDNLENLVVLGGEPRVTQRLASRHPQIASRISEIVEFRGASVEDVRTMCDALAEAPIADDLVAEIHRVSGGYFREIKNAIARCETMGKRNAGKPVTLADMKGKELCRDRKAGLPAPRR